LKKPSEKIFAIKHKSKQMGCIRSLALV